MTVSAYIGLGSNLGDGLTTLQQAWQIIGEKEGITTNALSSPYLSEPVGMESTNWFTNCVGCLTTELSAHELLRHLLKVESDFGRRRDPQAAGYQDRTLDLDIVYFGRQIIEDDELILPHPHLGERLFVLQPLAEIAPEFKDPADGLTMSQKLTKLQKNMRDQVIPQQQITRSEWPQGV